MEKYYVSGCKDDCIETVTCDDNEAQFWTLYVRDDAGLSQGIIDLEFREDAETAMAVYVERDALQEQVRALAAENAELKNSRDVLAENALETCNAVASAGFRHEAIMRGLMESTGNRNKYPKPITTLVDEALRKIETPATDAALREIRAHARAEGIHFAANRLLAAWESGFVDDTPSAAHDISGAILSAVEFLPNAFEAEFKRDYADEVRARIRAGEQP